VLISGAAGGIEVVEGRVVKEPLKAPSAKTSVSFDRVGE